jgi:Cu(I)/Ag(I) efflux system membrane fusion protein
MKQKKTAIILIMVLIGIAGVLFYLSKAGHIKSIFKDKPLVQATTRPASGHSGHEGDKSQSQSQAAKEQEEEQVSTVEIPLEKQQLMGVRTVEVSVKPLQKIIRAVGRIEYDEKKIATVNTKFEGWIERLYADYSGVYVKKGAPLAEVYSPELFATQQEFINLIKWRRQSKSDHLGGMLTKDAEAIIEAAKQRLRLFDITENQIQEMEKMEKPGKTLTIYSPVSGYVLQKTVLQGMRFMPGEKLFDIADLSTVWVIADIYEYELPLVNTKQRAVISLSNLPGKEFSSTIDYIYPALSADTKTAKIRFIIPNPGLRLKPQMFADVQIKIDLGKKLSIPEDAIIDTGTKQIVYVDKGEGSFEPREVALGFKGEGIVEVRKGLKAGEKVASAANFLIDSEAKLKGVVPLHKSE